MTRFFLTASLLNCIFSSVLLASQYSLTMWDSKTVPSCSINAQIVALSETPSSASKPGLYVQYTGRSRKEYSCKLCTRDVHVLYEALVTDKKDYVLQLQQCGVKKNAPEICKSKLTYSTAVFGTIEKYWHNITRLTALSAEKDCEDLPKIDFFIASQKDENIRLPIDIMVAENEEEDQLQVTFYHDGNDEQKAFQLTEEALNDFVKKAVHVQLSMKFYVNIADISYEINTKQINQKENKKLITKYYQTIEEAEKKKVIQKTLVSTKENVTKTAIFLYDNLGGYSTGYINCTLVQQDCSWVLMISGSRDIVISLTTQDVDSIINRTEQFYLLIDNEVYHITQVENKQLNVPVEQNEIPKNQNNEQVKAAVDNQNKQPASPRNQVSDNTKIGILQVENKQLNVPVEQNEIPKNQNNEQVKAAVDNQNKQPASSSNQVSDNTKIGILIGGGVFFASIIAILLYVYKK